MKKESFKTISVSPITNTLVAGTVKDGLWQGQKIQLTKDETVNVIQNWISGHLDIDEQQLFVGKDDVIRIQRLSPEKYEKLKNK